MIITQIKEEECPDCGCKKITGEKKERQHCNGYWNEYRTFDCGLTLHFSPNFMRVEKDEREICVKSKEYHRQYKINTNFVYKIKNLIKSNTEISEDLKKSMMLSNDRYYPYG